MLHAIYKLINITSVSSTSRVTNFRIKEPALGKSALMSIHRITVNRPPFEAVYQQTAISKPTTVKKKVIN
jgi:hypothetical protein